MCITTGPAQLSGTRILAHMTGDGRSLLGYQNTAEGGAAAAPSYGHLRAPAPVTARSDLDSLLSGRGAGRQSHPLPAGVAQAFGRGGNAMILPIPAEPGTMGPDNAISTVRIPHVLRDIAKAVRTPTSGMMRTMGGDSFGLLTKSVQVFDHGLYTVVLANNATTTLIQSAIASVAPNRRPTISTELIEFYQRAYPDWTLAICCFANSRGAAEAGPLLWHYQSMFPDMLFAPGVDAHDGNPPDLSAEVLVDHTVALSVTGMLDGRDVVYSDDVRYLGDLLPNFVIGTVYPSFMTLPNGDFWASVEDVRNGRVNIQRVAPELRG